MYEGTKGWRGNGEGNPFLAASSVGEGGVLVAVVVWCGWWGGKVNRGPRS